MALPTRREWEDMQTGGWGTYDPDLADADVREPAPSFRPAGDQRYAGRPLARWDRRAAGALIDFALAVAVSAVLTLAAGAIGGDGAMQAALYLGLGGAWLLNTVVLAGRTGGKTAGRLALGTRLVTEDGRPAGYDTAALREVMRLIYAVPFAFFVDVLWALGDRRQTLRDRVVRTWVIEDRDQRSRGLTPT
jgi:uncharacterized RDD family membrane protein YckC